MKRLQWGDFGWRVQRQSSWGETSNAHFAVMRRVFFYPVICAILLWILKSVFVLLTPVRALTMTPWLIDDSFIFMRIARNLATGRGYSFDGINPTSGAPLLWTFLTSLNHFFLTASEAIKATLMESSLFGSLSALAVFYLAYRLFNGYVAWGSFLLCLFSAPMFLNSMNGMGTELFTFLGLSAAILYVVTDRNRLKRRRFRFFTIGALVGLTVLVRADGAFLALAILCLEGFGLLSGAQDRKACSADIVALLSGMALFASPSVVWSIYTTGTPFPANQLGRRFLSWHGAASAHGTMALSVYAKGVADNVGRLWQLLSVSVGSSFAALLAVIVSLSKRRARPLSYLVALYLATYFGALVLYQGYFPDVHGLRYLNLPGHLLVTLIVALCYELLQFSGTKLVLRSTVLAGLILSLLLSSAYQYRQMVRGLVWAREMRIVPRYTDSEIGEWWAFLDWVSQHLPEGTPVAAKDHGRLAYFTGVQVVDLAGIIDPALTRRLMAGSADEYLEAKHVQYALLPSERERPIHEVLRGSFNLEKVPGSPVQEGTGYHLYKVVSPK